MKTEIRIAGFGGQGVITLANMIGRAAVLHDGRHAVLTEDYGPEKTGGWSRADVIVSQEPIVYPIVQRADVLVALSQDGYTRFCATAKPGSLVLVDADLVRNVSEEHGGRIHTIPARREADALGLRVLANIVMLGALVELTRVVTPESALKAMREVSRAKDPSLPERAYARGAALVQGVPA